MEEKDTSTKSKGKLISRLLSKYVIIWVWTILVGLSSGLVISFIDYRLYDFNWGEFCFIVLFPIIVGLMAAIISLYLLARFLKLYIISIFLMERTLSEDDLRKYSQYLKLSFYFFILSTSMRAFLIIVNTILVLLR